jgi:hypothetical protein
MFKGIATMSDGKTLQRKYAVNDIESAVLEANNDLTNIQQFGAQKVQVFLADDAHLFYPIYTARKDIGFEGIYEQTKDLPDKEKHSKLMIWLLERILERSDDTELKQCANQILRTADNFYGANPTIRNVVVKTLEFGSRRYTFRGDNLTDELLIQMAKEAFLKDLREGAGDAAANRVHKSAVYEVLD